MHRTFKAEFITRGIKVRLKQKLIVNESKAYNAEAVVTASTIIKAKTRILIAEENNIISEVIREVTSTIY